MVYTHAAHSLKLPFLAIFLGIISVTNKILLFSFLSFPCSSKEHGDMTLSERGSVLVFLPGMSEIRYMQEALSKLVHKR